ALALLLDLRRLPDPVAQVVELGAPHIAPADHLDPRDGGRVQREGALDADAVAHLADLERLAHAGPRPGDPDTLEDLDAFLLTLDDAHAHLEGVARREAGDVGAQAGLVDEIGRVHRA